MNSIDKVLATVKTTIFSVVVLSMLVSLAQLS